MHKMSPYDSIQMPAMQIPSFRTNVAIQNGVERNLLLKTWGGLGDQICAEPTLRHTFKTFKGCEISLGSYHPDLFAHLPFKEVFDLNKVNPVYEKYFVFETITNADTLTWEFFSHCLTNCVDFPSLCSFRMTLPTESKEIIMKPPPARFSLAGLVDNEYSSVFVHAGRHWPSKTFPKEWWDEVINGLLSKGIVPVLIGADTDDNRGTVDVDASKCIDLRNKTSVLETLWVLQRAKILITNDSSPLHMAASRDPEDDSTGLTHIGYIATCKHPDYITHWRRGPDGLLNWQWRETNLGLGGMWDLVDNCPNKKEKVLVDKVDEDILRSWLPEPSAVVSWAKDRV